jgi:hypothetical protein
MSGSIFLSASVPRRGREFYDSCHPYQIHTAIRSLLVLGLGRRHIVFGGHPSITPMVHAACKDFDLSNIDCVTIYQSKFFEDEFPLENKDFADIRLVSAEGTSSASVASMREQMLSEQKFTAGVFIGGMNGILDEYKLFTARFPEAKIVAVRAGGGATATLPTTHKDSEIQRLESSREYFSLYASVLEIDPTSERSFAI